MLAVIGGTGFYSFDGAEVLEEYEVKTPFGEPSGIIVKVKCGDNEVVFLPRHGVGHKLLPHEVNYRANIWALKSLGARQVVSVSAVGSLREEIRPGEFVIPDQYVDRILGGREKTFFGGGLVAHVSMAEPVCGNLSAGVASVAEEMGYDIHTGQVYGCVDGPRLGTKAESFCMRGGFGCDVVGMTNIPEVFLAREAQLCYCSIGVVTDYDCWMDDPESYVTAVSVIERYKESLGKVKDLLVRFLEAELPKIDEEYRKSLQFAVLSDVSQLSNDKRELLELLGE